MKYLPVSEQHFLYIRGPFYFYRKNDIVYVYMGKVDDPESEHILSIDVSYAKHIAAGLSAFKHCK